MYLMQAKMQEGRKKRLSVPAAVERGNPSVVQTMARGIVCQQSCRQSASSGYIPENVQNSVIQMYLSVHERTKNAKVGNRHNIPHPFFDLGGWYKTLMTGRIKDLFLTQSGFETHATQIQQELNRLINAIPSFEAEASLAINIYVTSIKDFIIENAKKAPFDFPKFLFHFPNYRILSIQKDNNILYINGKRR